MAIKNKDGTVYEIRGPNPLLQSQKEWDRNQIRLINCKWSGEIVEDRINPVKESKKMYRDIGEELNLKENPPVKTIPAREFIKEASKPIEPEPEADGPISIDLDPRLANALKDRGVEFYCATVIGQNMHRDEFYDNDYTSPVYGEQYLFDAILVDQSDLELQFWCVKSITKGSIVYRKVKEGGQRWWRVKDVQPKTGGYLVSTIVSDSNPDFS